MAKQQKECPGPDSLAQWLIDTHPADETISQHVDQCANCQAELDRLSDTGGLANYQPHARNLRSASQYLEPPLRDGDLGSLQDMAIESWVGAGGMGVVFRGVDLQLGRSVAVKILSRGSSTDADARFARESRAAAGLDHPNVVPVFFAGRTTLGQPYLVMPFIDGPTLRELVREGPLDIDQAAEIVQQVALGLNAAHEQGLIHRDVKPGNILLDNNDGQAKLADFGLVRSFADETLTQQDMLCGTPEYMSPEQASRPDLRDRRGDVYALGIVLYECLAGSTPFRGRPLEILEQHREIEPLPPSRLNQKVSRDLETICLKAIAKNPDRRYQTALEFAQDLQRWRNNEPILARPPTSWERASHFVRKNKGLVASISIITALLVVGTTISTLLAISSSQNADAASRAATQAKQRLDVVVDAFRGANPKQGAEAGMTAGAFLEAAMENIRSSLSDDPVGKSIILSGIGESLLGLGDAELAIVAFQEARALSESALGETHPDTLLICRPSPDHLATDKN